MHELVGTGSFTKQLEERVEMNETETVTLECETSHTVSTKWQHNGVDLSGMDHRELVQEGRSHRLIIKRATLRDAGTYTCSVKGQITTCEVTVHGMKPDFVRKLEDFEVKEQEVAILEVEVTSETADVVWKKDGLPVECIPGKLEVEKNGNVRKLLIRSTSVHDEGEYTCSLGDQECAAEVTVIELPPQIHTNMQDVTVTKGEKAILEVELTKGDALVRWFKDDKELHFSEHVQLSIDGKKQKLKIYQAETADAGIYSCRVGDQPDQVSTARVTVEEPLVEFITRLPDVTTVPLNSDAVFTVELSRPVEVKWLKKGKEIKPSNRYIIEADGAVHKLTIKKVTTEDQTEIACTAFNVKTSSKLKVEKIEIAPRIKEAPKEYKVKKGEDVTIEVKFTASPPPTDEWTVNGTLIKKSKKVDYTISEESASLTIKKVEEVDVGSYTLRLKNTIGEAFAEMTLIIMQVPGEPGTPDILEVTDDSVTLHWKAPEQDGNSPITRYILEFHDKEEFMEWHEVQETITTTTHKVTNLTHDAEIMFRVSAENEVGRGPKSPSTKYVRITTPVAAEPPVIQEHLQDTTVGLNQNITLQCVVGGTPLPEIKWYRNGKPIPKSKKMTYENRVATYSMEKASENHAGTYGCKASNSAGTAETTCKLLVQDVPKLEVPEAVQDQRLTLATQWKPEVTFSGFPRPDITWEKDGETIISDKRVKIFIDETTTTIAIYSVERADTGRYTVRASNIAGEATADLTLRVVEKPGRPEGPVKFSNITSDSITVSWLPPLDNGGLDLTKYLLEKCEATKQIWTRAAEVDGKTTTHSLQKLIENTEYMFRVFAINSIGSSEPLTSEAVVVRTYFNKPSPPRGPLEATGMTETSCTISWQPPEDDGGTPVIDYTVHRKDTSKRTWESLGTTTELSLSVSNLVLNSAYTFKIVARNKEGDSEPYISEDPIVAGRKIRMNELTEQALYALLGIYPPVKPGTYSPPSAPLNFNAIDITSKSVTLQWQPPASTGGTELTGYIIEKQYGNSKKWSKVVTLDPGHLQYCVENLKEKSELYFRIYAENMIGLSTAAATSVISLQTHATVPSPPTDPLEIRSLGPNSIIVEWGVPETDGGAPLEGYKIAIRDVKKTMWMEVGQVSAEVQKLTIKDLQENHEYLVRIFARNEVGLSDPLESDEPFLVKKPTGMEEADVEERSLLEKDTPSLSFSTENTSSWMREAGMDADIHCYAKGSLLRRSEYFFRIWYYAKHLFK
ncbi:titin-like [Macrosteles quadrilineatus]|uniref:titin-like n=1 Tax=Macrosteles quadrilineatus TaxID=74068 RepID=UPI0023E13172|nr:titin-like [Macrosteles quadrilineatus]